MNPIISDSFVMLGRTVREVLPKAGRVCIVGDTNTMSLFAEEIRASLETKFHTVAAYTFPAGEEFKTLDSIRGLLGYLLEQHFDRGDALVAVGGGVTGDMTGFAAAIYLRGIAFVQVPTTLLAQIDSSIGGKTGVDYQGYKNMVGAFHMPSAVFVNTKTLNTLPDDQFISGMGEVVKSALLADKAFYDWLIENREAVLSRNPETIGEMIRRTEQIKIQIVNEDPTEKGIRAYLNLGHTIGHAIEKNSNFSLQHGCCVALGTIAAARMSERRGYITEADLNSVIEVTGTYGLPTHFEDAVPEEILAITKSDKKMHNGRIRFVLLEKLGSACLRDDVTDEEMLEAICYLATV